MSFSSKAANRSKSVSTASSASLFVVARAGCGKTTTTVDGIRRMFGYTPHIANGTTQQKAIWKEMKRIAKEAKPTKVFATTFSRSLADEMEKKLQDVSEVKASGIHSFGFGIIRNTIGWKKPNTFATWNLIQELFGVSYKEARKDAAEFMMYYAVNELVSKCKVLLKEPTIDNIREIALTYQIDTNGKFNRIADMVAKIIHHVIENAHDLKEITFDDQIWLPIVLNLPVPQFDFTVIDETQDLNECQTQLVLRSSNHFMVIGDDRQAIFGFAGANCDSLQQVRNAIETKTGIEPVEKKLTKTFRCGKAIANTAAKLVPDFEAFESNADGVVVDAQDFQFLDLVSETWNNSKSSDACMVVCRTNAPLVNNVFKLIKAGIPAYIQGRDMVSGLINIVDRSKATTVSEFVAYVETYRDKELTKLDNAKYNAEEKRVNLHDKCDILQAFADNAETVADIKSNIQNLFSDGVDVKYVYNKKTRKKEKTETKLNAVRLSSIHRAKGLEAETVFFLFPHLCPHPMAMGTHSEPQEYNLKYVAETRAISNLTYVHKSDM